MSKADRLTDQPDYLQTFSLKCEPFANDLDGRFFYGGSALMQRLDLLTHLTQFGDAVVLVSGPPGSGKTTLLGRFAAQANKQWRLCLINADEFGYFQQRLADTLRIDAADDETRMLEQWVNQTDASQLLVIVIDNAEQLPESAFEKLCTLLNQPCAERIRLILFGSPEAQQTLKQALDQKSLSCTTQLLEVPRLSEEETASYLMYRLAVAGYSGECPFTATEIRGICKAADGRPADINLLARESLLEHQARVRSKRGKPKKTGTRFGALFWGPAALLVVAGALYLGWERLQPVLDRQSTQRKPSPAVAEAEKPDRATVSPPRSGQPPAGPRAQPQFQAQDQPRAQPEAEAREADAATSKSPAAREPAPVAVIAPAPQPKPTETETPSPPPPPTVPPAATAEAATPTDSVDVAGASEADDTTAITAAADASAPQEPAAAAVTAPQSPSVDAPVAAVPPTPAPAAATATAAPHREDWLLAQDENAFALQLLGSRSEESILAYIKRHGLAPDALAYYRGNYRGSEWFVLVYGTYADKAAALAARDALPAKVRADKPWPRQLKSVHKAIREMQ